MRIVFKITKWLHDSFKTNDWGIKNIKEKTKQAMTAPLNRDSIIATFSHLMTVDVRMDRSGKGTTVRDVQNSQLGFIDPSHIPEGKNCGLVKNLAITTMCAPDIDMNVVYAIIDNATNVPIFMGAVTDLKKQ